MKVVTCLIVFVFIAYVVNASIANSNERDTTSGWCGDDLKWRFDNNTLTIFGDGRMNDFDDNHTAPWKPFRKSIYEIVFEGNVASIGNHAFDSCVNLVNFTITPSILSIGTAAFLSCTSITNITIPATVKSISGLKPFGGCTHLQSIFVEENNTNYKSVDGILFEKNKKILMFYPPTKIGGYEIPTDVEIIDYEAFSHCKNLTYVTIPNGVTDIRAYAFSGCSSLTSVYIPQSVKNIKASPFDYCTQLVSIDVDPNNTYFKSENGVLFSRGGRLIEYPSGKMDSHYTIPDGVTALEYVSFHANKHLKSLIIPSSVTRVSGTAFGSSKLEVVIFLGYSDPGEGSSFANCKTLRLICVPFNYSSDRFCERREICRKDSCQSDYQCLMNGMKANACFAIENHCYASTCENGEWRVFKRSFVDELKEKGNACADYKCSNETGIVVDNKCKSVDSSRSICVDNKCAMEEAKPTKGWSVNITIDEIYEVDTLVVAQTICDLTGFKSDELVVGIEMNDQGMILCIVVYVDSEQSALTVAERVNEVEKGDDCGYGLLCHSKRVKVSEVKQLSRGEQFHVNYLLFILTVFVSLSVI